MGLFFDLASIEISERGKIVCIADRHEPSPETIDLLERLRIGNAIIVDLDSLRRLALPARAAFLREQIESYFPEWADYPSLNKALGETLSRSGRLGMLQKEKGDDKIILPIIAYEGNLFAKKGRAGLNQNYAGLMKNLMLKHELSHLVALIENDGSHSLLSEVSDKENFADKTALRIHGMSDRDSLPECTETLVCWRSYSYLFHRTSKHQSYPCTYILDPQGNEKNGHAAPLANHVAGIHHVVMTWLFHNEAYNPVVCDYRNGADSDASFAYLSEHPDLMSRALTDITKRLRNDEALEEREHLSEAQIQLIKYGLTGFSMFDAHDVPDPQLIDEIGTEIKKDFALDRFPHPPTQTIAHMPRRNRVIAIEPPSAQPR